MKTDRELIEDAISIAAAYGGFDGGHHKMWVIDQMVRALTDCPVEIKEAKDCNGFEYHYEAFGESEAYKSFIKEYCVGEDGPEDYNWDVGIAP